MRSQPTWTRTALHEIARAHEYIFEFNPRAAAILAAAILGAAESLAAFPHRGRRVANSSARELAVIAPFVIRYRLDGQNAVILRLRHTRKQPRKREPLPSAESP